MSTLAERLARPEILALEPFDIAAQGNSGFGADAIKLDANENPYPPLVEGPLAASVNRYPEPQPPRLKAALSALYGVQADNVVITRGADDAIDMLVRTFCRPEVDAVAICTPSFSAYAHFVGLQGARLIEVPLAVEFDFNADAFIGAVKAEGNLKLAFICTPNNPTGNEVDPALILQVADALPNTSTRRQARSRSSARPASSARPRWSIVISMGRGIEPSNTLAARTQRVTAALKRLTGYEN